MDMPFDVSQDITDERVYRPLGCRRNPLRYTDEKAPSHFPACQEPQQESDVYHIPGISFSFAIFQRPCEESSLAYVPVISLCSRVFLAHTKYVQNQDLRISPRHLFFVLHISAPLGRGEIYGSCCVCDLVCLP